MPRQVPPEQRRQKIAEAVLRITTRRGLDAVSLRDVAAEAGVSMGLVQHYFTTKDQMLLFACQYTSERADRRVRECLTATSAPHAARATLRTVCVQILPLNEERSAGSRVWIAFLARAVVEPNLAAFMRETWARTHDLIAEQLRLAQASRQLPDDLDVEREAVALFSFVDGLSAHVLVGQYTAETALAAVDRHLDGLFGAMGTGELRGGST